MKTLWNFLIAGLRISCPWLHVGKQDDLSDGGGIGQEHHQPVDSDSLTCCGRHAVFQGFDVVVIHEVGFVITRLAIFHLLLKPSPLIFGVIEFGKAVGDFPTGDKQFEPFGQLGMFIASSR